MQKTKVSILNIYHPINQLHFENYIKIGSLPDKPGQYVLLHRLCLQELPVFPFTNLRILSVSMIYLFFKSPFNESLGVKSVFIYSEYNISMKILL